MSNPKHIIIIGGSLLAAVLLVGKATAKPTSNANKLFSKYKGIKETNQKFYNVLFKMWKHLGYSNEKVKRYIDSQTAWSAAFISYAFRNYSDFPKSASHSYYIVDARTNFRAKTGNWHLRGRLAYKPKVGDIVCKNRAGNNYSYQTVFKDALTHCDIVIEVHKDYIITIGGNVSNQIKKTKVNTKNGYINHAGYFAIIQNKHLN